MNVKGKAWTSYIDKCFRLSEKAQEEALFIVGKLGREPTTEEIAQIILTVGRKYGGACGALAVNLYDALVAGNNLDLPPAEMCAELTADEALSRAKFGQGLEAEASKVTKIYSVRTMQKNAARDGVKLALIPSGDGCAFCKMLASRGWVYANDKAFEAHLHPHCRCNYVPQLGKIEGYNPDAIYNEFMELKDENGVPYTDWNDRLNAMRRKTDR